MSRPTERLRIIDPDAAIEEILAFAARLEERGERAWFEVRYPAPGWLDEAQAEQWAIDEEDTFDAIEVINGEIRTLPAYGETS